MSLNEEPDMNRAYLRKDPAGLVALCLMASLVMASAAWGQPDSENYEQAEKYRLSPDPVSVLADGLIARPLGLVSTIVGSVGYVLTLPFSLPSDSEEEVRQQLVEYPAWFTFKRPMGHFGHRIEGTSEFMPVDRERLDREAEEARKKNEEALQGGPGRQDEARPSGPSEKAIQEEPVE